MDKKEINKYVVFSLWCQKDRMDPGNKAQSGNMYCQGALKNMELANEIYPGWKFRFYIDNTVPDDIINKLKNKGAEIINMQQEYIPNTPNKRYPGMFWRFLPMNDPLVDIFIVRDVDSRINSREALAVEEWIKSGKRLHVMRDHPHHYYKILGGMWGYDCRRIRYDFTTDIREFMRQRHYIFKRMDDMKFLDGLYDSCLNYNNVLEHDTFYKGVWGTTQLFPECNYKKDYNFYHYVGEIFDENNNAVNLDRDSDLFNHQNYKVVMADRKDLFR